MGAVELPRRIAKLFATDFRRVGLGPTLTAAVAEVHDGEEAAREAGKDGKGEPQRRRPRSKTCHVGAAVMSWKRPQRAYFLREFRFRTLTVITLFQLGVLARLRFPCSAAPRAHGNL